MFCRSPACSDECLGCGNELCYLCYHEQGGECSDCLHGDEDSDQYSDEYSDEYSDGPGSGPGILGSDLDDYYSDELGDDEFGFSGHYF